MEFFKIRRTIPFMRHALVFNIISLLTFIVGASLLMVPGAVRGFAVVHCLGILTSIFSSVVVSRAMVNLVYGHRRKVERLAIGNTAWK